MRSDAHAHAKARARAETRMRTQRRVHEARARTQARARIGNPVNLLGKVGTGVFDLYRGTAGRVIRAADADEAELGVGHGLEVCGVAVCASVGVGRRAWRHACAVFAL